MYVTTDYRPITLEMLNRGGVEVMKITRDEFNAVWYEDGMNNEGD
jgi:hypothetical protein